MTTSRILACYQDHKKHAASANSAIRHGQALVQKILVVFTAWGRSRAETFERFFVLAR
jgi:hypothetical protein